MSSGAEALEPLAAMSILNGVRVRVEPIDVERPETVLGPGADAARAFFARHLPQTPPNTGAS